MKIAVLGGGAMGALYGGYLSRKNDVIIVDVNTALIEKVKNFKDPGMPDHRTFYYGASEKVLQH